MFNVIVVALDGSEGSHRAIPVAEEVAKREGGRIVIAHVEEIVAAGASSAPPVDEEIEGELRQIAEHLTAEGVPTTVHVHGTLPGGPAPAIEEIADEAGADLIVAGTRGHGGIEGLLVGSVAQRLLHVAHRPVLVVPSR